MNKRFFIRVTCAIICMFIILVPIMNTTSYANDSFAEKANYRFNSGELYPNTFAKLPQGSIEAEEWLLQQLLYQKENLTGLLQDNWQIWSKYNAWRGYPNTSYDSYWEKGPYYLRGLVSLAWTLDDPELKEMAMEWINPILESGKETGYFGPTVHGDGTSGSLDWWPHMIVLGTLRDYYESTKNEGDPDERVLDVLGNYFAFQMREIPNNPFKLWSIARGGENIEVILWYYNEIYDPNAPEESDWLLGLAEMIAESTGSKNCDRTWTDVYINTTTREHTVDSTLALRTPAVIWQMTGDEKDRIALREAIRNWGIDHGRIDGMVHSDEVARENYPHRGLETCAVVEGMLSLETGMSIIGEGWIGDSLENLAYNTLPSCYTSDFTAHVYFQAENRVMATHGDHDQSDDRGSEAAYSVPSGYECCLPNMHMGWPKFVSSMYMATSDGGLAVIAYGPNKVTAKVADGRTAIFHQETDYPFKDTIGITYEGEDASFPLLLRIPAWCDAPSVKLNGETVTGTVEDGFLRIDNDWEYGDVIEIKFPREVRISYWYNNSIGVQYGALNFCLGVEEDWREVTDMSSMGTAYEIPVDTIHNYECYAASDWNYGILFDPDDIKSSFEVSVSDEIPLQPFTLENSPVTIKAVGQVIPEWELRSNTVPEPPYSPIESNKALQEEITLVPYGCAKLRITLMPWIGDDIPEDLSTSRDADEAICYTEDGRSVMEFDNVIVRDADNYTLKVYYEGSGTVTMNINSKYQRKLSLDDSGEYTLSNLISLLPTCVDSLTNQTVKGFKFDAGQYNNIRFFDAEGVEIKEIKVIPLNPFSSPKITSATLTGKSTVKLTTNLSRDSISFYSVEYGTSSGNYTHTVKNLYGETAIINGLEAGKTYYFRISALVNGKLVTSNETNVNIPSNNTVTDTTEQIGSFTDDFSNESESRDNWNIYGDTNAVTFSNGMMNTASSRNIKMTTGNESWENYALEATLSGEATGSNFGVIFRTTQASGGHGDHYHGYYVGIMANSSALKLKIGYADGAWHESESVEVPISGRNFEAGRLYKIKVLVLGNIFRVYLDDVFAYEGTNNKFTNGLVGVRAYITPFKVDSFTVRDLTENEIDEFGGDDANIPEFQLKGVESIYSGVQVATGFESPTHTYKLIYGTKSDLYTNEIANLIGLNRPTYAKLKTDKFCVELPENNKTYYFRLVALNGTEIHSMSKEYSVTTGKVINTSTSKQATAMKESLTRAEAADKEMIGKASADRLKWAIDFANTLKNDENASLASLSLARSNLDLAIKSLEKVELALNRISLIKQIGDESVVLKVIYSPASDSTPNITSAVWSSDNENVAAVDENGEVSFVGIGTATVSVNADGKILTCSVTVTEAPPTDTTETTEATDPSATTSETPVTEKNGCAKGCSSSMSGTSGALAATCVAAAATFRKKEKD